MTVSQPDSGARFELKRAKRGHLRLGKCPDITLTKGRTRLELVRTFCNGLFNLCGGELKTRRRPFVELRAEFPNRIESASTQTLDHRGYILHRLWIGFKQAVATVFNDFHEVKRRRYLGLVAGSPHHLRIRMLSVHSERKIHREFYK